MFQSIWPRAESCWKKKTRGLPDDHYLDGHPMQEALDQQQVNLDARGAKLRCEFHVTYYPVKGSSNIKGQCQTVGLRDAGSPSCVHRWPQPQFFKHLAHHRAQEYVLLVVPVAPEISL